MGCTLISTLHQYDISGVDARVSLLTGLSGAPIALRHWQYAERDPQHRLAHRIIALIQFIPLLGALAALIERVVVTSLYHPLSSLQLPPWRVNPLSVEKAEEKMHKNGVKAIEEHQAKEGAEETPPLTFWQSLWNRQSLASSAYATEAEVAASKAPLTEPLSFTHALADKQGRRESMEDAEFYSETADGVCLGVFDGHGGSAVSAYASKEFAKLFPSVLKIANGNVHEAFEKLIHHIYNVVKNERKWTYIGSTAVISYIDKKTGKIYTATLGDSEANIYRKFGADTKSIPLSCVRDFWSKKDLARLCKAHNRTPESVRAEFESPSPWFQKVSPKSLRSQLWTGVNVSRAIGDFLHFGTEEKPIVIHKPKITVGEVKKGDRLVLACDGVKDFVLEKEIVGLVDKHKTTEAFAKGLVEFAYKDKESTDNITALVVDIV